MVRAVLTVVVLAAATAWAGAGVVMAELGLGLAGVVLGSVVPAGLTYFAFEDPDAAGVPLVATPGAGAALGVWLAGERWDGRSANRGLSFVGALAGGEAANLAAVGCFSLAFRDDAREWTTYLWLSLCAVTGVVGAPALATVGYNLVKKPAAGHARAFSVTPALAALPPVEAGEPPTMTYGVAVTF